MAWLSRNNIQPTDSLTADMLNSLANDTRFWGGDVNAGGYKLTNVILSGSGGFERMPSPAVIAPVVAGGASEVQLSDWVAGTPDTFPPRWKLSKAAQPVPDFAIERWSAGGSLIDKPLSIRMADGIVALKAQQWTGPVNAEGQTLSNVVLGSGVVLDPGLVTAVQTPWKQNIDAASFSLDNAGMGDFASPGVGTSQPGVVIRSAQRGPGPISAASTPKLMFHWAGIGFSQIGMDDKDGAAIRTYDGGGTAYANFLAARGDFAGNTATSNIDGVAVTLREYGRLGVQGGAADRSPRLSFYWAGLFATQLGMDSTGTIRTWNQNGDGFASVAVGALTVSGNANVSYGNLMVGRGGSYAFILNADNPGGWIYSTGGAYALHISGISDRVRFLIGAGGTINTTVSWVEPMSLSTSKATVNTNLDLTSHTLLNAVIPMSGLGSGTPDATKYLRGDGTWQTPPGASGGQPQTPWAQPIDGAGYSLSNAGLMSAMTGQFKGDATATMSGPGVEVFFANDEGRIQVYDRPSSGFKGLRLLGSSIKLWSAGTEVMRVESGKVTVSADGVFSGYVDTAAGKGFTGNLYLDGSNWRYSAAGAAFLFHPASTAQVSIIYTAPTGAAGAVAAVTPALMFRDDGVIETPRRMDLKFTGSSLREINSAMHFKRASGQACAIAMGSGGGVNGTSVLGCMPNSDTFVIGLENGSWVVDAIRFKYPSPTVSSVEIPGILAMSNANGERIVLFDGGGGTGPTQNTSMGIENNAWWFKCHSAGHFRWYVGNPPDEGASAKMYVNGYGTTVNGTVCIGGGNALTLNAHYTDTWRYQGPGNAPAFAMYGDWNMNSIRIMAGVTGSPGGAIAFTEVIQMHPSFVKVLSQFALGYVPTSASGLASGSVWRDAAAGNVLKIVP